jgi:hypothetical protein
MEAAPNVLIERHNTDESKLVLERMMCDYSSRRPQHIDTDKDWWNKKTKKTDQQPPTTLKRKSPVDSTMTEGREEEEEEGQFSLSEQLLFKNLSEAISDYQEPSEQRRHHGRNNHDGALEIASQLTRNRSSEEAIIPNKRRRYQRRKSFVIRRENNMDHPFSPPSLLESYDDDDDDGDSSPAPNRSTPDMFIPKADAMPSDTKGGGAYPGQTQQTIWNGSTNYRSCHMSQHPDEELIVS